MNTLSCAEATSTYPMTLFFLGSAVLAVWIKISEGLTIKQPLAVMIGVRRRTKWNGKIDFLHAATLILPLGLWIYLIQGCAALQA